MNWRGRLRVLAVGAALTSGLIVAGLFGRAVLAGQALAPDQPSSLARQLEAATVTMTYQPTATAVPNPERGFYRQLAPMFVGTERTPLTEADLREIRAEGITVIRAYYVLDEFIDAPLPPSTVRAIDADFSAVRRAGLKIIPRFAYSFPCVGALDPCDDAALSAMKTDAPLEQVFNHIDSLAPVLRGNADVIAFVEAGFVGAWGEWHHSSSGLVNSDNTANANSSALLERLLWAVPESRKVALRTPLLKQSFTGADPLTPEQAHLSTPQARLGEHNDCFLHGPSDGLLQTGYQSKLGWLKKFLFYDNLFVPQGGETCAAPERETRQAEAHAHCETALRELEIARYDVLNLEYHPGVIDLWKREGCFADVQNRLGYRFRLVDAQSATSGHAGDPFTTQITVANDGWSAPYNPRMLELVLRHRGTGRMSRMSAPTDARRWLPNTQVTVTFAGTLPADAGTWDLLVNLPDPDPRLYGNPSYSIQFANDGLWEPATGFNRLGLSVDVQ